jgi:hypothetical protein
MMTRRRGRRTWNSLLPANCVVVSLVASCLTGVNPARSAVCPFYDRGAVPSQVLLWQVASTEAVRTEEVVRTDEALRTLLGATEVPVQGVACFTSSVTGRLCVVASGGRSNRSITIWNADDGEALREWDLHAEPLGRIIVCPGDLILTALYEDPSGPGTVGVFGGGSQSGTPLRTLAGQHHHLVVQLAALEPDDATPLVLTQEAGGNATCAWDVGTGKPYRLMGHPRPVTPEGMMVRRAYCPDLPALACAGPDGTWLVVLATFRQLAVHDLQAPAPVSSNTLRSAAKK